MFQGDLLKASVKKSPFLSGGFTAAVESKCIMINLYGSLLWNGHFRGQCYNLFQALGKKKTHLARRIIAILVTWEPVSGWHPAVMTSRSTTVLTVWGTAADCSKRRAPSAVKLDILAHLLNWTLFGNHISSRLKWRFFGVGTQGSPRLISSTHTWLAALSAAPAVLF